MKNFFYLFDLFKGLKPNFKLKSVSDFLFYFVRILSFDRKLIAPGMYLSNNVFTLKLHMLFVFFFPVLLIMIMFFDSYMTIDYVFFFYTDEADFDDFIALVYMVLFFFLILADYDTVENHNHNNIYDYTELALKNSTLFSDVMPSYAYYNMDQASSQPRNISGVSLNYYDKNFFSKMLFISSNSMNSVNSFVLLNLVQAYSNKGLISKLPINRYILDDNYALNLENKFGFLTNVVADDLQIQDSNDIYIYSFYLILFDLELSRLFLFINNILLSWLNNSLNYLKFFNENALILIRNNLDFSVQLRSVFNKKVNNISAISPLHKVYLTNYVSNINEDIEDSEMNNYISWFFYRK